jgi:hypothetical protein
MRKKQIRSEPYSHPSLPLKHDLKLNYILSYLIAAFIAGTTVISFIFQSTIYPSTELLISFLPSDAAMLIIGLPTLLVSISLTKRGVLTGLLLWPGVLLFVFYNYLIYVLAVPFNLGYLLQLTLVGLSAYNLISLVPNIDGKVLKAKLTTAVPERLSGIILVGLGLLFFIRSAAELISFLINQTSISDTAVALNTTYFLISPVWIACGILLWKRKGFGYKTGLGMLFQASMSFIGLIFVLIVQPLISSKPFPLLDIAIVFVMGFICFIPMLFFLRGVKSDRNR